MPLVKLNKVLQSVDLKRDPVVTIWNRVEGRPRKPDFNRALRAEIRDPLWMLTKQWQMGEFEGDDAASPIQAKVLLDIKQLEKIQLGNNTGQSYNNNIPLEGTVEQMNVPFTLGDKICSLDLRLMIGRYWLKLIKADKNMSQEYAHEFPINVPDFSDDENNDIILAHSEVWQKFTAAANRKMDGYEFYLKLKKGLTKSNNIDDETIIAANRQVFESWVEKFFIQPVESGKDAYMPSRLEYQFKCSYTEDKKEKILEAEEYYSGRLDWFNLSINDSTTNISINPNSEIITRQTQENKLIEATKFTFIPVNIDYDGMPDTRWWKFEDRKTYLGNLKADTTDISKLLFLEYSLLYANDWFLFPQELPAASISKIKGLVVTNCFGERTWIEPTGKGADDDWQRWSMFTIDKKGKGLKDADNSLLILPTVPKIQEGPNLERIALIRDEISNMVWAIETDITLSSGDRKKGTEAARELTTFYKRLYPVPETVNNDSIAQIRYNIMNTVPENWIPFIPVHVTGNNREIQLQRASMPRILHGETSFEPIKPRTHLLRVGLDSEEIFPYYIHEEEIPRAGICISRAFQRTRWTHGETFIWLGMKKETGRGEGYSNLQFDQIEKYS